MAVSLTIPVYFRDLKRSEQKNFWHVQNYKSNLAFPCWTRLTSVKGRENCRVSSQLVNDIRNLCLEDRVDEVSNILISIKNKDPDFRLDTFTYNNLLSSYVRVGRLQDAHEVFVQMFERNVISWASLITGYTRQGRFVQAMELFEEMMKMGEIPNEFILGGVLKSCDRLKDVGVGMQLHSWAIVTGFEAEVGVRTGLIAMYSSCGFIKFAQKIFDESIMDKYDIPLWNSMLSSYVSNGQWHKCFEHFSDMLSMENLTPTEPTYASMISACASSGALEYGKALHGKVIKNGMVNATNMGNSLVTFYGKCGCFRDAGKVLDGISQKNIVSWNAIISAKEQSNEEKDAVLLFGKLIKLNSYVKPNRITFLSVLSAVSSLLALKNGQEIHAQVIKSGLELDTSISNSLITMYAKCRELKTAKLVFERMQCKDIISWNSMLSAYEQNGRFLNCLVLFKKLCNSNINPDDHSFTIVLDGASSLPSPRHYLRNGQEIHCYVLKNIAKGLVGTSTYNAILTMYAKCNRINDAEKIFKEINGKDLYSWNAMMDGYAVNGYHNKATLIFIEMLEKDLQFDHLTLSILLTLCARLASINLGKMFHAFVIKHNHHFPQEHSSSLSINNSLVSMYSKCGSISDSSNIFTRMLRRDVFSWTAIITGYAHHGKGYESLQLFDKMKDDEIRPNSVTFLGLLSACAHSGLIDEGCHYFKSMEEYGVKPSMEHYACIIDLFGRFGEFKKAKLVLEDGLMALKNDPGNCLGLWRALLGTCHAHKNLELGEYAAKMILQIEPGDETVHILLYNLYASFGMWEEAIEVRKLMKGKGLKKKEAGFSWVEIGSKRHSFIAGDVSHPERQRIYLKLEELNIKCRRMGYNPVTEFVLHDVDDMQKEAIIACHSEKLAVSFSLLDGGRSKSIIRIIKNLRVCPDCHNWMKFVSLVEGKEIVCRDSRRFHFFKNGKCSCQDYW